MMTGIKATMRVIPNSRTPKRGSRWSAICEWNGRTFEATSRSGASFALCRELVAAGCPDQPMEVWASRYTGPVDPSTGIVEIVPTHPTLRIASIHKAAGRTIKESDKVPVREATYEPHPGASVTGDGQKQAISPSEVPEEGSGELRVHGPNAKAA